MTIIQVYFCHNLHEFFEIHVNMRKSCLDLSYFNELPFIRYFQLPESSGQWLIIPFKVKIITRTIYLARGKGMFYINNPPKIFEI
jgi:hypothetical protein